MSVIHSLQIKLNTSGGIRRTNKNIQDLFIQGIFSYSQFAMFYTFLCMSCGCVANQCLCACVCVCVSSPTAGFRVTIQHPPTIPFAACVACLIPSPSCSSISLSPPLLCIQPTCVYGGWGMMGYTGDNIANNQRLFSLKQQCGDAKDAKCNVNCKCMCITHTDIIQYHKEEHNQELLQ